MADAKSRRHAATAAAKRSHESPPAAAAAAAPAPGRLGASSFLGLLVGLALRLQPPW